MRKNLFLLATDGLCNRMRTIDSAITLSGKLTRNLRVIWVKNPLLNSSFQKLFKKIDGVDIIEAKNQLAPGIKINPFPKNNPTTLQSFKRIPASMLWKFHKLNWGIKGCVFYNELLEISNRRFTEDNGQAEKRSYDLILEKIEASLDANYSNYIASCWRLYPDHEFYSHFRPVAELSDRVDAIAGRFDNTIGLHIRRTDHREAIAMSGLDKFISLIDRSIETNLNSTFFLATDDRETEHTLRKRFAGRIITNKKTSFARDSEQGIQDALVDLYCLSRTKKIYGSFRSSFSQVAGDIARIEVETVC